MKVCYCVSSLSLSFNSFIFKFNVIYLEMKEKMKEVWKTIQAINNYSSLK